MDHLICVLLFQGVKSAGRATTVSLTAAPVPAPTQLPKASTSGYPAPTVQLQPALEKDASVRRKRALGDSPSAYTNHRAVSDAPSAIVHVYSNQPKRRKVHTGSRWSLANFIKLTGTADYLLQLHQAKEMELESKQGPGEPK